MLLNGKAKAKVSKNKQKQKQTKVKAKAIPITTRRSTTTTTSDSDEKEKVVEEEEKEVAELEQADEENVKEESTFSPPHEYHPFLEHANLRAFLYWVSFCEWVTWPHITEFESLRTLVEYFNPGNNAASVLAETSI